MDGRAAVNRAVQPVGHKIVHAEAWLAMIADPEGHVIGLSQDT
jgi:hypothetical protein